MISLAKLISEIKQVSKLKVKVGGEALNSMYHGGKWYTPIDPTLSQLRKERNINFLFINDHTFKIITYDLYTFGQVLSVIRKQGIPFSESNKEVSIDSKFVKVVDNINEIRQFQPLHLKFWAVGGWYYIEGAPKDHYGGVTPGHLSKDYFSLTVHYFRNDNPEQFAKWDKWIKDNRLEDIVEWEDNTILIPSKFVKVVKHLK